MAPSKTAPKSASPMSTATTRFDFFSLSRTITNKPYTNFFFFFIRANLLIDSIDSKKLWLLFCLGIGCGYSESYQPRRVSAQRKTSSK